MITKTTANKWIDKNRLIRSDESRKKQNMSICDTCGTEISKSHYRIPAELKEVDRTKFVHMECCSAEEIKRSLLSYAENQIRLYQDVVDLIKDTNMHKIRNFETKYGVYEEILQGVNPDHDLYTSALISGLKRRISTAQHSS